MIPRRGRDDTYHVRGRSIRPIAGIESGSLLDLLGPEATADDRSKAVLSLSELQLDEDRHRELAGRLVALLEEFADDEGRGGVTAFVAVFPSS